MTIDDHSKGWLGSGEGTSTTSEVGQCQRRKSTCREHTTHSSGRHSDHPDVRTTVTTLCCTVVKLGSEHLSLAAWELAPLVYDAIPATVKSCS